MFHWVSGGSSKILLLEPRLLPLVLWSFIGSLAEAAKSCFLRHVCCLWSWGVSSGLRRKQQNPASDARFAAFGLGEFHRVFGGSSKILLLMRVLLPLVLVIFIVSLAEAAKSCFLSRDCCLWSLSVSLAQWRKRQNPAS